MSKIPTKSTSPKGKGLATEAPTVSKTPTEETKGDTQSTLIGTSGKADQKDVIGFKTEGKVKTKEFVRPRKVKDLLKDLKPKQDPDHSIQAFLARPIKLDSFNYTEQNVMGNVIYSIEVTDALLKHPCFTMFRQKMQGFLGFTGTMNLKLVINAQPFEAGVIQMAFAPFYNGFESTTYFPLSIGSGELAKATEFSIPFVSGLPSQVVNVGLESEAVLSVPYTGPNTFINLVELTHKNHALIDIGRFIVQALTPKLTGTNGGVGVEITPYLYFTDVTLFGAVNSVLPQSFSSEDEDDEPTSSPIDSLIESLEAVNPFTVEDGMDFLMSNALPIVEDVVPEVQFVKGMMNAARALGFSKPNAPSEHDRVAITPFNQMQNCDGTSNAAKFALSSDNGTQITSFGPTEEDELSIVSLVSKPNYLRYFRWKTDQETGTLLAKIPVGPISYNDHIGAMDSSVAPSKLYYVSHFFKYWRGTINFTFHFAATKFHSGRIRLVYELNDTAEASNAVCGRNYGYSQIIDVRDGITFTVQCPYIATTPWRPVPNTIAGNVTTNVDYIGFQHSFLSIYVENKLRAPANVSDVILVPTFISGGPDFELACPTSTYVGAVTGQSASPDSKSILQQLATSAVTSLRPPPTIEEQAFEKKKPKKRSTKPIVLNMCGDKPQQSKISLPASAQCMGEKVTSLRQLIKRYQFTGDSPRDDGDSVNFILPFYFPGTYSSRWTYNYLPKIMPLFRYYRGGMRFIIQAVTNGSGTAPSQMIARFSIGADHADFKGQIKDFGIVNPIGYLTNTANDQFKVRWLWRHPHVADITVPSLVQGGLEIQVPYYGRWPQCLTGLIHQAPTAYEDYDAMTKFNGHPPGIVHFACPNSTAANTRYSIYRAAADDFQLCFSLGAPIMTFGVDFKAMSENA